MRASLVLVGIAATISAAAVGCGIRPSDVVGSWVETPASPFTTGPYIHLAGPGTALIALKATLTEPPVVEWWMPAYEPDPGEVVEPTEDTPVIPVTAQPMDDLWVARLPGLPEHGLVHYRVRSEIGDTRTHRFRVSARPDRPFRFAAFGDTRTGHAVHRAVVEAVNRELIDFVVNTGDMVERGGIEEQWDLFFQIERPLLANNPLIPSIGNHDLGNRNYYEHYFLHDLWVGERRYYTHDWGNLRIIAIDGEVEARRGGDQYAYVEQALAEGQNLGRLMMISLHYPPYSSGHHGSNDLVHKPVSDLARRYGVELVLAGHDHNYERTKSIHGTTFVVSGSAGAPIRAVKPQHFSAVARTEPHYMLVDVHRSHMVLRAVNLQGTTFDSFVIADNPPDLDFESE